MYLVMLACWSLDPRQRPSFLRLVDMLSADVFANGHHALHGGDGSSVIPGRPKKDKDGYVEDHSGSGGSSGGGGGGAAGGDDDAGYSPCDAEALLGTPDTLGGAGSGYSSCVVEDDTFEDPQERAATRGYSQGFVELGAAAVGGAGVVGAGAGAPATHEYSLASEGGEGYLAVDSTPEQPHGGAGGPSGAMNGQAFSTAADYTLAGSNQVAGERLQTGTAGIPPPAKGKGKGKGIGRDTRKPSVYLGFDEGNGNDETRL
jgi:hypothetical protein